MKIGASLKPDSLDVALRRSSVVVVVIDMGAW
jgi:hypothetical protein